MNIHLRYPGGDLDVTIGKEGLVIGHRDGGADLELDDPALDARHAKVWFDDGPVWYEDLHSRSGSWFNGRRLEASICLEPGDEIKLGESYLSLATGKIIDQGMELLMAGSAGRGAFTEVLGGTGRVARYVSALSEFVQDLLVSGGSDSLAATVQRLGEVVPSGQVSLVAWPLGPGGRPQHLVPPTEKARPVSRSLAQNAVNRREALLFSEAFPEDNEVEESTRIKGISSAVYVPLMNEEQEVEAILCIDSPSPRFALDPDLFQFLRAVGGLLASALTAHRLRDEARRKELEARQLESHREALANFLSIASHDLRSPLAVVRGFSALIDDAEDLEEAKKLNARVRNAGSRAAGLIRAYLEAAALTSDKQIKLEPEEISLRQLVDEELAFVKDARDKSIPEHHFENRVDQALVVVADRLKLGQVLNNLITNAARYTPEADTIAVEASTENGKTKIAVIDQGVGISEEDQKQLFQQFQRVGKGQVPGTGLGLWLTASLVRAHGGEISVESRVGEGTTFLVTLPQGPPIDESEHN